MALPVIALDRLLTVVVPPDPFALLLAVAVLSLKHSFTIGMPPGELADRNVMVVISLGLFLTVGIPGYPMTMAIVFALLGVHSGLCVPPIVGSLHDLASEQIGSLALIGAGAVLLDVRS